MESVSQPYRAATVARGGAAVAVVQPLAAREKQQAERMLEFRDLLDSVKGSWMPSSSASVVYP
jgi:hypothetical protein